MQRPSSAVHAAVAASGLLGLVVATALCVLLDPFDHDAVLSSVTIIAFTAASIALPDLVFQKVHRRHSTGLDFAIDSPSWQRTAVKLLGLLGSAGFIGGLYWLLPEYKSRFYAPYFELLKLVWPYWAVAAVPYFYFIDRRMRDPADGYWQVGRLLLGQWRDVDRSLLVQHALGWLVKGFFLPLMFVYLCQSLDLFWSATTATFPAYQQWHNLAALAFYMIDAGLVCVGYVFSLRLLDSHLRAAEPTMLAWVVAIICYEPFSTFTSTHYFRYWTESNWMMLFGDQPAMLVLWGIGILGLSAFYTWATVMFGARFSNLTHRGIITSGPYRFTKHPAYLAKNLSWWMMLAPLLFGLSSGQVLQSILLLFAVNFIYLLRAKTEERLLRADPVYVEYAEWIDRHGLLRFLRKVPGLRFKSGLAAS